MIKRFLNRITRKSSKQSTKKEEDYMHDYQGEDYQMDDFNQYEPYPDNSYPDMTDDYDYPQNLDSPNYDPEYTYFDEEIGQLDNAHSMEEYDETLGRRAKYSAKVDNFLNNGIIISGILLLAVLLIAFLV